ncbi:MAG: hypothetical protein EOP49_18000 [Sphingobacteriales bacterium]|nr:MAG: hypothetical protein EOP49_18000 [Sphingobacteriales bacterium]
MLHDELAPLLLLVKYQVDHAVPAHREPLEKASQQLTTVMLRLSEIASDLNAHKLVKKGLRFALEDFLLEVEDLSQLKTKLVYDVCREEPETVSIHLYRMSQEIVQNVMKHAHASQVAVQVKEKGSKLYLLFSDNGKGFAFETQARKAEGIGLQSIRSRTGMLGGTYRCTSSPGKGTRYFFVFPFQTPSHDQGIAGR